ncbi:MAG TPA: protein kinase [Gemmataceae bacterium]|nr:protein kinase [Gemmataceae bacterium]
MSTTATPRSSAALPTSFSSATHEGKLYWQSVARVGIQAADALAYAHAQGTLHRDIKPANLLLDTQGILWITDFGLAKAHDSENLTHTGDVVGTLRYMAPERFEGKADARSDVYSLGLTLYEMLTLRAAYDESERTRLLHKVMRAEAPRPRKLNPAVPRDLETIVLKAIAADPAHRYQTAQELREDLERFRDDKPIFARPVGEVEKLWRWSRRNPMPASLAAAFLLSLALGITGITWKWLEAVDGRRHADTARQDTQRVLAGVMLDRGIALAEQGDINVGLFWMLEALRAAPEDAERLRWTIGANLSAWTAQTPRLRQLINVSSPVHHCALHPDGKRLLTVGGTGNVVWWDLATGEGTPLCKVANPLHGALSPDAAMIVSAGQGGQENLSGIVQRWDAVTGKAIGPPLVHPALVRNVVFTPNGKHFVTGCDDGMIRVWNASSGTLVRVMHAGKVNVIDLAISPDGKTLASATADPSRNWNLPGAGQLWDLASGKRIGAALPHKGAVRRIAFSPDGKRVATAGWDSFAQQWDTTTCKTIGSPLPHRRSVNVVRFSPDGQTLATGTLDGIDLWSASTSEALASKPNAGGDECWDIAWSLDGATLVSVGQHPAGDAGGAIRVFEASHPLPRATSTSVDGKRHSPWWNDRVNLWFRRGLASYCPLGARLVIGGDNGMARLVAPISGLHVAAPLRHRWNSVHVTAFSPDGKYFATSSRDESAVGEARLWDADSGKPIGPPLRHTNNVAALAFSPDGKLLASGGYDRAVHLWDTATAKELAVIAQPDIVLSLTFRPDGQTIAIGHSHDYSGAEGVILCDVASRKNLGPSKKGPGILVCWSNDGKRLALTGGATLCIWRPADDTESLIRESGSITSIQFQPGDRSLLTADNDGTLRLRDPDTGKPTGSPMVANVPATVAVFGPDPDGKLILAGYADGTARLWDSVTQKSIGPPLRHGRRIAAAAIAPDGRTLCTTSEDGVTRSWPVPTPCAGNIATLRTNLEARTGLVMMEGQAIAFLDEAEWKKRREQAAEIDISDDRPAFHAFRAREARDEGERYAARWHLDRLIALEMSKPSWSALAQRASLASDVGEFAEAARDYARAEKVAPPSLLQVWYRVRIFESMSAKRWQTAAWYVDRLLPHEPKDWQLYYDRAVAMAHLKKDAEYEADLTRAVAFGADAERLLTLADDCVRRADYAKATRAYALASAGGAMSYQVRTHHALAAVKQGDLRGYRRTCARAIADLGPNPSAPDANAVAWLCVFGPDAVEEIASAVDLAEKSLAKSPPEARADVLNTLGCILYRAGRHEDAIQRLNEGIKTREGNGTPIDFLFLAMAHHRLGKTDAARRYFAQVVPTTIRTHGIWQHLEQDVIYCEAEALLKSRQ